jgi:hypothetical protein
MSATRFGSNITVDGGPGRIGDDYSATVVRQLHRIALTDAGRAALATLARASPSVRIVPSAANPAVSPGDLVVRYTPAPVDHAGTMLLGALLNALRHDGATEQATGRRIEKPVRITTPVGQASPIMWQG